MASTPMWQRGVEIHQWQLRWQGLHAVPCGLTGDGLPVGAQLLGKPLDEATLLRVGHVIESLVKGAYDPGVITCVPYAIAGALLVAEVWREFRRESGSVVGAASASLSRS